MMKVLIIEDNRELSGTVQDYLQREGYICSVAATCDEASDRLASFTYDAVLLDLMLPDGNGLSLLKDIRARNKEATVMITSAKDALDDKVHGLESGADDYLTKPFHLSELHARLRAIYRRKHLGGGNELRFEEIAVDPDNRLAKVADRTLDLTAKEFDLLLFFLVNKDRVLSRQSIAEHLWGDYTDTLPNFDFVYQHIKNLRRKITAAGGQDYITTQYGLGYRFTADRT